MTHRKNTHARPPAAPRKRRGFSAIEAMGAVTIGVVFIALAVGILADQRERERASVLAADLALALEGGENYLRANLEIFSQDNDELGVAATQSQRKAQEICLSDMVAGDYIPSHLFRDNGTTTPFGLRIHVSAARLENANTEKLGKPDLYAIVAFTQGDTALFSNKALLTTAEHLGDKGGYGTDTNSGRSFIGWGTGYANNALNQDAPTTTPANTGPLWQFSGTPAASDFPVVATLGSCATLTPTNPTINMTGQAVAVAFVTVYPPSKIAALEILEKQTLTTDEFRAAAAVEVIRENVRAYLPTDATDEYISGCGTTTVRMKRFAGADPAQTFQTFPVFSGVGSTTISRDLNASAVEHFCYNGNYVVPNPHMARLQVSNINAHTIEAMRLVITGNNGILKVKGDLKTPALRIDANELLVDRMVFNEGVKSRRFNQNGAYGFAQPLNNLYINNRPRVAYVCGYRSPTATSDVSVSSGSALGLGSVPTTTACASPLGSN